MARIIVIGGNVHSLVQFRGDMIQQMVEDGNEVFAMAPATDLEGEAANLMTQKVSSKLQTIGVPYLPIPLNRTGINPVKDLHTILWHSRKIGELKPDVVLAYTMKPVIYGSIAARLAGVEDVFSMITGLGYVDGKLHIQLYTPERHTLDFHASLYLTNDEGTVIYGSAVYRGGYSGDPVQDREADYIDYVFDVPKEELSKYTLQGDFYGYQIRVDGNWSITFPLEQG